MRFFLKPKLGSLTLLLLCVNFISFAVFYIPNYVVELYVPNYVIHYEPLWLAYFREFFSEGIGFLIVPIAVTYLYFAFLRGDGMPRLLLSAVALSATKCIYNLPFYYLKATAEQNDWIESTLISFGKNIGFVALDLILIILLTFIAVKLSARLIGEGRPAALSDKLLNGDVGSITAISTPDYKALFSVSAACFIYRLIFRIADIVIFLAEYHSLRDSEIIFNVLVFVFLIIFMLVSYVLQALLYNNYKKELKSSGEN